MANDKQRSLVPSGYRLIALNEVDSTNEEAKRQALAGNLTMPVWIQAGHQTAGRGRRGREWQTDEGNVAASLLLEPHSEAQAAARLSFVAALAVYDMLSDFLPQAPLGLKWPNDVLVDRKKIAGILLEAGPELPNRNLSWLVVGIGINIVSHPSDTPFPATHLLDHVSGATRDIDTGACFTRLAYWFDKWLALWREEGFLPIREAWLIRAVGIGQELNVRLPQESFTAVFETLDATGNLVLVQDGGKKRIIGAGEVYFTDGA